jgi:hypothetical protein
MEAHRMLSARDLRAVAKAAATAPTAPRKGGGGGGDETAGDAPLRLRLPPDYEPDSELLRSTSVVHVPVDFIKGAGPKSCGGCWSGLRPQVALTAGGCWKGADCFSLARSSDRRPKTQD